MIFFSQEIYLCYKLAQLFITFAEVIQKIMAGNLFQRYVWLLDTISRRQGIEFDDIDHRWQSSALNETKEPLPKRTFLNHINAIYKIFGVEIGCESQGGRGYYIKESGDINLRESQSSLLQHLQMSNAMLNNPRLKGRIVMDRFQAWLHFTPLITAMNEERVVRITCRREDRGINNVQHLTIEPYFIKQFKSWFLAGRVAEDGLVHAFAFSSIRNVELTDKAFKLPKEFDAMEYIIKPQYIEPSADVSDDSDLFVLERAEDRIHRRSRDKRMYESLDDEWDYAELELQPKELIRSLRAEREYRNLHLNRILLASQEGFEVTLFSDKPGCEPFVIAEQLDDLVKIKVSIKDGHLISVESRHTDEKQPAIERLTADARAWLDTACQEPHFNGTNRDYAQWMWQKLKM